MSLPFYLDVRELSDRRVIFKLELEPAFPQQPSLVVRSNGEQQELPLEFQSQANGRDLFTVALTAGQPFDYALRVTTPGQSRWITPKGEEHDWRPHNWFRCEPRSLLSVASDAVARHQVEPTFRYEPPSRPAFATPAWVRDAVFYQIFPERFARGNSSNAPPHVQPWGSPPTNGNFMGGNLQGIIDRLAYLADLGITALYLTPIFQSLSNHKYDTMDYFAVDPHLGDLALLRRLVDTCHQRGLRVVLDGVFNHCSDQHPFFVDVKRHGRQSRYWNWFHIRNWPIPDNFGGAHGKVLDWYDCWWGFHTLPKLNYHHPEVEEYFLNVATYWLREAGTDGWRLDVPNEVIQSFWPKFRRAVKAANPDAYIVGEIWDDATPWLQGDQFDAVMNYRFQRALIEYFAEEHMDTHTFDCTLRTLLLAYPEPATAVMLNLLGSHDTARPMTVAHHALHALKLMAAMQFTFPGAPCVYYGDEIGLEGDKDPDCRRCYPWGWEQEAGDRSQKSELLAYYKKLIALRKANPALRRGAFQPVEVDSHRQLYAFECRCPDNHCLVALNRSGHDQPLSLPTDLLAIELLGNQPIRDGHITVPARQAIIVRLEAPVPIVVKQAAPPQPVPIGNALLRVSELHPLKLEYPELPSDHPAPHRPPAPEQIGRRTQFSPEQKIAILRQHFLERVPIANLCDQHQIDAAMFLHWKKQLFEYGAAAFAKQPQSIAGAEGRQPVGDTRAARG